MTLFPPEGGITIINSRCEEDFTEEGVIVAAESADWVRNPSSGLIAIVLTSTGDLRIIDEILIRLLHDSS